LLVEAFGYQAFISREIESTEGNIKLEVELKKTASRDVVVLTPTGEPAADAEIAVGVPETRILIHWGTRFDRPGKDLQTIFTNDSGKFPLQTQSILTTLVILHPTGFGHLQVEPGSLPEKIKLREWARITGTYRVGKELKPKSTIEMGAPDLSFPREQSAASIQFDEQRVTDDDGRFRFDRVIPGKIRIGRFIRTPDEGGNDGVSSGCMVTFVVEPGEHLELELGGKGRPVVGRLLPPNGFNGKILWNQAKISASVRLAMPPPVPVPPDIAQDRQKVAQWRREWLKSPAGIAWKAAGDAIRKQQASTPTYTATVGADGEFRIDDLEGGTYSMSVSTRGIEPHFLSRFEFVVPPVEGEPTEEPLDLEEIRLDM
jgi:hypothetical protein